MIALLGFGKTNQALLSYLDTPCVIFDDSFTEIHHDTKGNIFAPSTCFQDFPSIIQIPTPGIPPTHPLICQSKNLISEYDFLLPHTQNPQIWVSGTNGKTTTTEMLEWILKDFGAMAGGNIGIPLAQMLLQDPKIWIVETSSFSLHYTKKVFPKIYLLLPLSEDHISWHGSFQSYIQDKLSPITRMTSDSIAILPESLKTHLPNPQCKLITYKNSSDLSSFAFSPNFKEPFLLDALLALSGAKALKNQDFSQKLLDYQIGLHKIEEFQDNLGRLWVDDSKGTNIDATIWAVQTYQNQEIYLILGGDDKGADLTPLFETIKDKNIQIFAIGSNAKKLQALAQTYQIPCELCEVLENAIQAIHAKHTKSSVALLSPAAASLDQFQSYKHRGEVFKKLVKNLA